MMLLGQMITGAVVSTVVTVWVQVARLVQGSAMVQMRLAVKLPPTSGLVLVLRMVIVTLVPLQASTAVGLSKVQAPVHWTVLLLAQVMTGGVVSTTVMVWLQVAALVSPLQLSLASQVRVTSKAPPQQPAALVMGLSTVQLTLVPLQEFVQMGGSKFQLVPHWTVLLEAQLREMPILMPKKAETPMGREGTLGCQPPWWKV